MAQLFPMPAAAPGDEDRRPSLASTLVALPDPWILLRNRRIGDTDAGPSVELVLVHPEIGVALLDEAPRDPTSAIAPFRAYLDEQGFREFFPGELPIVALSIAPEDFLESGERLAAAFEAAPALSIADPDWADAVVELLLMPDDLAIAAAAEPEADPGAVPPEEPEEEEAAPPLLELGPAMDAGGAPDRDADDRHRFAEAMPAMVDWPFLVEEAPPRGRRVSIALATALGVLVCAGVGIAAWQLGSGDQDTSASLSASRSAPNEIELSLPRQPEEPKTAAESPAPSRPAPPAVPAAPPVVLAEKPLAPPPPAPPAPTRVEPLPQVTASASVKPTPAPPPAAPAAADAKPEPQVSADASSRPKPPLPSDTTPPPLPPASAAPPPPTRAAPAAPSRPAPKRPAPPSATTTANRAAPPPAPNPRVAEHAPEAPSPPRREARLAPPRPRPPEPPSGPPIDAGDLPPLEAAGPAAAPRAEAAAPEAAPRTESTIAAAPAALESSSANQRECRPYTADSTLAGRGLAVQGIACRDANGEWRLVSEVPLR